MRQFAVITSLVCFLFLPVSPVAADEDGAYSIKHKDKQWGQVQHDKALVYIIRPAFIGFAVKFWAYADDQFLGVTNGKNYTYAYVTPGEHVFWSRAENVNALKLNVQAGKTYYLQQHVRAGAIKATVDLELLDESEAKRLLEKCKYYVTPSDRALAKARDYLEKGLKEARSAADTNPDSRKGKTFSFE